MNTDLIKMVFRFLLGIGGLTAMNTTVSGDYYYDNNVTGLNVTGYAERMVKSDYAVFELTLSVRGDDCKKLFEKLNNQVQELKQFWLTMGVKSYMIFVDHRPDIKISETKQKDYSIQYRIFLTMDDLDMASVVQKKTHILVEKGFVFSEQRMYFYYSKGAELQKELTKKALKDGEKTAMENAQVLGIRIEKTPNKIKESKLICASTYENPFPFPFERFVEGCSSWGHGNADIDNKFSVLVNMTYAFKKNGEKSEKAPSKRA